MGSLVQWKFKMPRTVKHTGFQDYVTMGKFTPEFIHDYEYWCKRIFFKWSLFTDFENFYQICWEALLDKINEFDPKIATIQTFCISRINNEAWRLYMKNKGRRPEIDCSDPVIQGDLVAKDDLEIYEMFSDFIKYAEKYGISVNVKELYKDYSSNEETPAMVAFAAWRAKRKDIIGRNDLEKKRKKTVLS